METKNIFKPILFNTDMVQAIEAGRKTQTRRILKVNGCKQFVPPSSWDMDSLIFWGAKGNYQIGDILWVKETTKVGSWREDECKIAFDYKASPEQKKTPWCFFEEEKFEKLHLETIEALDKKGFEAAIDEEREYCTYHWEPGESPLNWKPSLFMPKEAARIFLKVTNVRCERLQDISQSDSLAEGIIVEKQPLKNNDGWHYPKNYLAKNNKDFGPTHFGIGQYKISFETLWESINGKKHPWESNPWVWVYDFERIEKPADFI